MLRPKIWLWVQIQCFGWSVKPRSKDSIRSIELKKGVKPPVQVFYWFTSVDDKVQISVVMAMRIEQSLH